MALGVVLLVAGLVGAEEPLRQTREFREVVECGRAAGDCFAHERGTVAGRRTYITTSTSTDADGHMSSTTTTHYEVTWVRADGSRESRDVSSDFYDKAAEGEPVTLRLWHGEVVGVEVTGAAQRMLPSAGRHLAAWLYLAHLGLGLLLWGLFLGWWDGLFLLGFRAFAWMFLGAVPVHLSTRVLAYGLEPGPGLVVQLVVGAGFVGVAVMLLRGSI